jgi:uncharacterized protein (TIGR03067 family)
MKRLRIASVVAVAAMAFLMTQATARTWTSSDGKYKVEAELVAHDDRAVTLKKTDGTTISVPLARLSQADRDHLAKLGKGKPTDLPKAIVGTWLGKFDIDEEKMRRLMLDNGIKEDELAEAAVRYRMILSVFRSELTLEPDGTYHGDGIVANKEVQEAGSWELIVGNGEKAQLKTIPRGGSDEVTTVVMRGPDEFTRVLTEVPKSLPAKGILYTRYDQQRSRAERAKLEGAWLMVSAHAKGVERPDRAGSRYVFRGNRVTIGAGDGSKASEYRCHIDATHEPFRIDLVSIEAEPPIVQTGICRLQDGELTLCLTPAGCPYPRGFKPTKLGDMRMLFTFRRESAKPK